MNSDTLNDDPGLLMVNDTVESFKLEMCSDWICIQELCISSLFSILQH